jgi:5-hydroxyisourate hydrolase
MSAITTHVLDTSIGRPAAGISVLLEAETADHNWKAVGRGTTDSDGRLSHLAPPGADVPAGTYRLTFDTGSYFQSRNQEAFYPRVVVIFSLRDPAQHYHVPLLLNPYGYTTYRGS